MSLDQTIQYSSRQVLEMAQGSEWARIHTLGVVASLGIKEILVRYELCSINWLQVHPHQCFGLDQTYSLKAHFLIGSQFPTILSGIEKRVQISCHLGQYFTMK